MKRRDFLGAAGAGLLGLTGPLPPGPTAVRRASAPDRFIDRWSWAMGQSVHLMLFTDSEARGYEAAARALAELRRVEGKLSLFDPGSDIVELNRLAGQRGMKTDVDLSAVLSTAEAFRRVTGGAFNVAVEPLMSVWGFRSPRTSEPTAAGIAAARQATAAAVVRLDGGQAFLTSRHTQLDFGGIGVGYGLDRMAVTLRASGIERAFIDISGDCLAIGTPPGQSGWPVGIVDPAHPHRSLQTVLLADRALATSANTESVVRFGQLVRGHVMDPGTGYPADRVVQTTSVARMGIVADVLSTAMLVAGRRLPGVERAIIV